jgi:hypothetical protein
VSTEHDPPHDPAMPGPPAETSTEERRLDLDSRKRVAQLELRYRRFQRLSLLGQAIVAIAVIAALIAAAISYDRTSDTANESKTTADLAAALAKQINTDRRNNIYRSCRESNDSNRETTRKLDALLAERATDPTATDADRERLRQSRDGTVTLINALRPYRDCDDVVRKQVSPPPKRQPPKPEPEP